MTRVAWCLSVLSMISVWTAEAFNPALECLTDLASPDLHPLAGKAKDVAAAVVLITAVRAATIDTVGFVPHMWTMNVSFP